ncbi:hypothetical protein SCLCIDRAFT_1212713, partial [Scleroderma citrinum Foug A]
MVGFPCPLSFELLRVSSRSPWVGGGENEYVYSSVHDRGQRARKSPKESELSRSSKNVPPGIFQI